MLANPSGHWNPANFGGAAFVTCVGAAKAWSAANPSTVLPGDSDRAAGLAYAGWIDCWLNHYDAD
jgi:hypothetical protein